MKLKKVLILSSVLFLGGALLFLYGSYNPSEVEGFPKCPSYSFLGLYCPGCGSQRAVFQLLNFNLNQAFRYNSLLVIMLPLVLYALGVKAANYIFGTHYQVRILNHHLFAKALLVLVILYFILRNLEIQGLEFLRPPL
ncbi:DUF2752 domain-containing protein [Ornithobacterium rhinotracheale]|nr:DUF2752 domain-containing protein [Ornithobacterium rhinotracheale]